MNTEPTTQVDLVIGGVTCASCAARIEKKLNKLDGVTATIKGNLFWAFAYNVAALPLTALGLLNPLIAGAAMTRQEGTS